MQEENTHGLEVQRLLRPYPQGGEDAGITNQTNGGVMDTEHGQRKCHKSYISCCQLLPANERPTNKRELSTYVFQRCSSLGHRSGAAQANEAVNRKKRAGARTFSAGMPIICFILPLMTPPKKAYFYKTRCHEGTGSATKQPLSTSVSANVQSSRWCGSANTTHATSRACL